MPKSPLQARPKANRIKLDLMKELEERMTKCNDEMHQRIYRLEQQQLIRLDTLRHHPTSRICGEHELLLTGLSVCMKSALAADTLHAWL